MERGIASQNTGSRATASHQLQEQSDESEDRCLVAYDKEKKIVRDSVKEDARVSDTPWKTLASLNPDDGDDSLVGGSPRCIIAAALSRHQTKQPCFGIFPTALIAREVHQSVRTTSKSAILHRSIDLNSCTAYIREDFVARNRQQSARKGYDLTSVPLYRSVQTALSCAESIGYSTEFVLPSASEQKHFQPVPDGMILASILCLGAVVLIITAAASYIILITVA
jgi:hypothetical protein